MMTLMTPLPRKVLLNSFWFLIRFQCPILVELPGDEFLIENWPVSDRAQSSLREITLTHIVNPLPVYEFNRNKDELKLVSPKDYEKKLKGAVVEVHFALIHHHLKQLNRHIFNLHVREMIVHRKPLPGPSSPFKRRNRSFPHPKD